MNDHDIEVLAAELGERLLAQRWRVATAESCTGGLVAGAITTIAGSSDCSRCLRRRFGANRDCDG